MALIQIWTRAAAQALFASTAEVRTPVTGDSLKEFFYELNRIRSEPVSQKEIADAKSYLTGVFPIRLETQEGLTDQLVQIKMLNLPNDYLQTYRDRVQAVTVEEIQRVAQKYVKPDEAALIVVGDGASVLDQMKPYCEDIEVYNTAGRRKSPEAASVTDPVGAWSIEVETPLGQSYSRHVDDCTLWLRTHRRNSFRNGRRRSRSGRDQQ